MEAGQEIPHPLSNFFTRKWNSQTEFELSLHVHTAECPDDLNMSIMVTIEPYVPATIRNVPETTTKLLKPTIAIHLSERSCCVWRLPQLSYNHMQPMG